jgi:hypothetical protein
MNWVSLSENGNKWLLLMNSREPLRCIKCVKSPDWLSSFQIFKNNSVAWIDVCDTLLGPWSRVDLEGL